MDVDFPFAFDLWGHTRGADRDDHVRDLIEQLLFTAPGERVNRPDFGSGILQLVFAPNSPELAATLQFTTQAAIVALARRRDRPRRRPRHRRGLDAAR